MEEKEMLEQTNDTENVETRTTEQNEEGIKLTDTSEVEETKTAETTEEKEEVKKTLKELLKENPDYQSEYNQMIKSRLDRKDREFQKELSMYKDTEAVLKTTIGGNDIGEINQNLRNAYTEQGVKLPDMVKPGLSDRELELLGKGDAQDFIDDGYDAMVEEANRLANIGYKNLNKREQVVFNTLAENLTNENNKRELLKLGVKEDVLNDNNFVEFRKQFNSNTPIEKIYSLYEKTQPKPKVEKIGSMKTNAGKSQVKDFYTYDEAVKFTREDLDKNPELVDIIEKSMQKW